MQRKALTNSLRPTQDERIKRLAAINEMLVRPDAGISEVINAHFSVHAHPFMTTQTAPGPIAPMEVSYLETSSHFMANSLLNATKVAIVRGEAYPLQKTYNYSGPRKS